MPDWLIVSASHPAYVVRIGGDADRHHAEVALQSLIADPAVPSDLELTVEQPPQRKRWWQRG